MPITFKKKQELVNDLKERINDSKSVIFADFSGLSSSVISDLRKKFRQDGVIFKVVKKTLLKKALRSVDLQDIANEKIPGQLSIAISDDEIKAAKLLNNFIKETKTENLSILGGVLSRRFLTKEEVIALAKIPGREELLGRLVGAVKSPVSGFVNVLGGNIRGLIFVLKQIKKIET